LETGAPASVEASVGYYPGCIDLLTRRPYTDLAGRVRVWTQAVRASEQLADELAQWCASPDPGRVQALA